MISVEEALQVVKNNCQPLKKTSQKSLKDAGGYILASDIYSPIDMPPFRQSAMDGYALNLGKSEQYNVIDEVKAGDEHQPELKEGEAVRIFTGAAVPETANAVMMQEKTTVNDDILTLTDTITLNANIRPKGEQVEKGALALQKGTKLTAAAIGYLTSLGITEAIVYNKPSISIIATGNELIKAGNPLPHGKIYESNALMLASALDTLGYHNVTIQKVPDDYEQTLAIINNELQTNDIVLISGGISVGDYDFVGKALLELGVEQLFYKVKQKPGKPLFFGKKAETLIFALPGNPAAALSCFYVYVHDALKRISGIKTITSPFIKLKIAHTYEKKNGRAQFLKALVENNRITILEGQSSAMLHTFALANALAYVAQDKNTIVQNEEVDVLLLPIH